MANIPDNVKIFLSIASQKYGEIQADNFDQFMWADCLDIDSPIEQIFYVALTLVSEANLVTPRKQTSFLGKTDDLIIVPQFQIDRYRIDFALRQHPYDEIICIELDGHEFHDRDERQRRYEKARDRRLIALGYKCLHFTGSEVCKNPCAAALEAFVLATHSQDYAINPMEPE